MKRVKISTGRNKTQCDRKKNDVGQIILQSSTLDNNIVPNARNGQYSLARFYLVSIQTRKKEELLVNARQIEIERQWPFVGSQTHSHEHGILIERVCKYRKNPLRRRWDPFLKLPEKHHVVGKDRRRVPEIRISRIARLQNWRHMTDIGASVDTRHVDRLVPDKLF